MADNIATVLFSSMAYIASLEFIKNISSNQLLAILTAAYVFLTYLIVRRTGRSLEISQKSIEATKEMITEMKEDRRLRFQPYVVPSTSMGSCKIDGSESLDQHVILKNAGSGPALDVIIIIFLFAEATLKRMIISQFSSSIAPASEEYVCLVPFEEGRMDALISFFPVGHRETLREALRKGTIEHILLDSLGFSDFGHAYCLSYRDMSGKLYFYKGGIARVESIYKIGSNPEKISIN